MKNILVSACLLGENVRYNGETVEVSEAVRALGEKYNVIPVCPEVLGGLAVPREACEIKGNGGGEGVLEGFARVMGDKGTDCTGAFIRGAEEALKKAGESGAELAVLKQRSPSCGSSFIYTGNFDGTKIPGRGVCAALFHKNGIRVISEEDL